MGYRRCEGGCRHGHGAACLAERTGHYRFCELADPEGPDYSPDYIPLLSAELSPRPPAPAAGPPIEVDRIARAIDLCPHRRSCQFRPPIACAHPDKAGPKTLDECRACVSAS